MISGGASTMTSRTARITSPSAMQWSRQIAPTLRSGGKWRRARRILDQLDRGEQAAGAHLADQRVIGEPGQRVGEISAERPARTVMQSPPRR